MWYWNTTSYCMGRIKTYLKTNCEEKNICKCRIFQSDNGGCRGPWMQLLRKMNFFEGWGLSCCKTESVVISFKTFQACYITGLDWRVIGYCDDFFVLKFWTFRLSPESCDWMRQVSAASAVALLVPYCPIVSLWWFSLERYDSWILNWKGCRKKLSLPN